MTDQKSLHSLKTYVVIVLALVGLFFLGISAHEFTHAYTYVDINYTNATMCLFQLSNIASDDPIGSFEFEYPISKREQVEMLGRHTELKAYIVFAIVIFVGLLFIIRFMHTYLFNRDSNHIESKDLNSSGI